MTPDQTCLSFYTCRVCGEGLDYFGVGRPPVYCTGCRPSSFPPLKGNRTTRHQVNGGRSPASRRTDPPTSVAAAASVNGAAVESLILEAFDQFGALTDDELVDVLDGPYPPTVKSARSRLSKAGCLVDSGMRRPSNRGRAMIVFEVVR